MGTLSAVSIAPHAIGAILGIMLVLGIWTPMAGVLIGVIEVWIILAHTGTPGTALLLAAFGATLAMIGPGAFSIDARLFGRKHLGG